MAFKMKYGKTSFPFKQTEDGVSYVVDGIEYTQEELDEYKKTGKAKGKTTAPTDVTFKSEEEFLREQRRLLQQQQ